MLTYHLNTLSKPNQPLLDVVPVGKIGYKSREYFLSFKNQVIDFFEIDLKAVFLYIMINNFLKISLIALFAAFLTACNHNSTFLDYKLIITVDENLGIDSVMFSLIEPDYGRVIAISQSELKHGKFLYSGQLDGPRIARLSFPNGKVFYFILEQCKTEILFSPARTIIWGGRLNHEFFTKLNLRNQIMADIKKNREQYLQRVADSTLTYKTELRFLYHDSVLNDSLQQFILHTMQRSDEVGILFKDRFFNDLDSTHLNIDHEKVRPGFILARSHTTMVE